MSDQKDRIGALSPQRRELLKRRQAAAAAPVQKNSAGALASHARTHYERIRDSWTGLKSTEADTRPIDFSLFFFSADETWHSTTKYNLLLEAARFADLHGFEAIWTPERHLHQFGGPYPNPSVLGAALAVLTQRIKIRAGSVVAPLHHSIRIAEEWAVVDNLSNGRVGLAFASGWAANDFVMSPGVYQTRKEKLLRQIDEVKALWRGDALTFRRDDGEMVEVRSFPRPVQPDIDIWLTTAKAAQAWEIAGARGLNVLSALLEHSIDDVAENVKLYRVARARAGHDPATGRVTLMLHTFLWDDMEGARSIVSGPLSAYLRTHLDLYQAMAPTLETFGLSPDDVTEADKVALSAIGFEKYFNLNGLFGTPETAISFVRRLKQIGVDEIACLIDFGVASDVVLGGLSHLDALRQRCARPSEMKTNSITAGAMP